MDLNSILIGSEDPTRLVEYYTRMFGEPGFTDGTYTGWMLGSGFVTVGPHSEVKGSNTTPGRLIWNLQSDDVAGDFARLQAAGAIVITAPYEFPGSAGSAIATLADPDGNYFQLVSPMQM